MDEKIIAALATGRRYIKQNSNIKKYTSLMMLYTIQNPKD